MSSQNLETSSIGGSNIVIQEHQLGVWKFKIAKGPSQNPLQHWHSVKSNLPFLHRLSIELFKVSPDLFTLYLISEIWQGVEGSVLMHFSNELLQSVERGYITGQHDTRKVLAAIVLRLLCSIAVSYLRSYSEWIGDLLLGRMTRHFELTIMEAKLRMDFSTSQKLGSLQGVSAARASRALNEILSSIRFLFMAVSQILLVIHISRTSGGPMFAFLCFSRPLLGLFSGANFFNYECFAWVNNVDRQRRDALDKFSGEEYRQDIIGANLGPWVISELKKAHERLRSISSQHAVQLYTQLGNSSTFKAIQEVSGDLPMIYCALYALLNPGSSSIASLAILQQSSFTLRASLTMFSHHASTFQTSIESLKAVYALTNIQNTMSVGKRRYPPTHEDAKLSNDVTKGMSLELKNVSFSYLGSQSLTPALKDVSLTIPGGHLVVIVGSNGSGKSTLIRILSRLYDPTSGELLIDGVSASEYKIEDLHETTVLLGQDSKLYPLTLAENIGLGYAERVDDEVMLLESAKEGGALKVIDNFKDGLHTVLDPNIETFEFNLMDNPSHPLYKEMEQIQKKLDVSGGERQKISASRAFMRFKSEKIKFVAVDEPSSALDAEAELQLFNNLIASRAGKTMIMVTHRFGHLTKYADMIICMKDGNVIEIGTHLELMNRRGEYANLYNIQAQAFLD